MPLGKGNPSARNVHSSRMSASNPPPPPSPLPLQPVYFYAVPPPPRDDSHVVLIVLILVIFLVVIPSVLAAVLFWEVGGFLHGVPNNSAGNNVEVLAFDLNSQNNTCGLAGKTEPGVNVTLGATFSVSWVLHNGNTTGCSITAARVIGNEFSLDTTNLPVSISARGTGSLDLTFTAPNTVYTGDLVIDLE